MGIDTTVLTDNMIAYAMEREGIDLFTSAADSIAWDGHIANKIGTFQIAILAKCFGVPYYVTGIRTGRSGRRTTSSSRCGTPPKSSLIGGSPTRSPG